MGIDKDAEVKDTPGLIDEDDDTYSSPWDQIFK